MIIRSRSFGGSLGRTLDLLLRPPWPARGPPEPEFPKAVAETAGGTAGETRVPWESAGGTAIGLPGRVSLSVVSGGFSL